MTWLQSLFDGDTKTVAGALVLLAITSLVGVMGWLGKQFMQTIGDWRLRRRDREDRQDHLEEVLVDILIHADFDDRSVAGIIDPRRITALKDQIDSGPSDYRPFVPPEAPDPTFADYRGVRRRLDIELMVACDRFFDNSQLFHGYYAHLASDAFAALSSERKKQALDTLVSLGEKVQADYQRLSRAMKAAPEAQAIHHTVMEALPARQDNWPDT
ncbi:hypothetical protein [Antarctobacter jejuensis]|uniref:hypothetical protein n=1 Tax=Antarctobacter jejuensis TaxID=1439938 RepID=UPI003FD2DAE1